MRDELLMRLRRALDPARRDEGSTMVMALMLVLIFAVAGVTLALVVGVNGRLALQTVERGKSVYVAEAGLDSALAYFRASRDSDTAAGFGKVEYLPCSIGGSADGSSNPESQFEVQIYYGKENPATHANDAAWLAADNIEATSAIEGFSPIACPSGGHPASQPYYALVKSAVLGSGIGARTLIAVYNFDLDGTRENVAGGIIRNYGAGVSGFLNYCLRADAKESGALIRYTNDCDMSDPADAELLGWTYDTDYKIRLASATPIDDPDTADNEAREGYLVDDPATPGVDESLMNGLCIAGPVRTLPGYVEQQQYRYRWEWAMPSISSGSYSISAAGSVSQPVATGWTYSTTPPTYMTSGQFRPVPEDLTYTYQSGGGTQTRIYNRYSGNGTGYNTNGAWSIVTGSGWTGALTAVEERRHTIANSSVQYRYDRPSSSNDPRGNPTLMRLVEQRTTVMVYDPGGTSITTDQGPDTTTTPAMLVDCVSGESAPGTYGVANAVTGVAGTSDMLWEWNDTAGWKSPHEDNPNVAGSQARSPFYCLFSGPSNSLQNGDVLSVMQSNNDNKCVSGGVEQAQNQWSAFQPESKVGAGNASAWSYQLVNFEQFGRCADVTGTTITNSYMIAYPCKQYALTRTDPELGGVDRGIVFRWNQKWYYEEPSGELTQTVTRITVRNSDNSGSYAKPHLTAGTGATHCLVTPTKANSDPGDFVTFSTIGSTECGNNRGKWIRYSWTGRYASSYTFQSVESGLCLSLNNVLQPTNTHDGWSKMVLETCNGSERQKWNAPADMPSEGLGDYQEIPSGGGW